ncbi:MAG: hypothetical protein ACYCOU_14385, partial [Sulfobacillus sp.]
MKVPAPGTRHPAPGTWRPDSWSFTVCWRYLGATRLRVANGCYLSEDWLFCERTLGFIYVNVSLKPQASSLKPQASSLKPQASSPK